MATCPECGVSSRDDPDAITVTVALVARPLGTFSLAGNQMKVSARARLEMLCRCGWSVTGWANRDYFYPDPPEENREKDCES